jgi:hypothetical protein
VNLAGRTQGNPAGLRTGIHTALGFRAHSGWAVMVAVAARSEEPQPSLPAAVIDRQRIELAGPGIPAQPYHAAAALDLKEAERLIERCVEAAERLAREALRTTLDNLRGKGYEVVGCGILVASGRTSSTLATMLASHAQIHTAEGELFRDAIARASEGWGLRITKVKERDLYTRAAAELGVQGNELQHRLADLGRPLGPPWRQDEKQSTLAGCLALISASR